MKGQYKHSDKQDKRINKNSNFWLFLKQENKNSSYCLFKKYTMRTEVVGGSGSLYHWNKQACWF